MPTTTRSFIEMEHEGFSFTTLRTSLQVLLNRQSHRLPILGPHSAGILRRRRPLAPEGNILLMGIVEEAEGVQNIRDILRQARGIGAIWAGPGDMSVSMGLRGQASHPAVQENLLRVLAACKEFGVPCATGATADDVAMRLEQGFRIIMTAPVRSTPGLVEGRRLAAR